MRGRLTLLYGGLFLASGVALLAITYVLVERNFPVVNEKFTGLGGASISGGFPTSNGRANPPTSPAAAAALISQLRRADLHQLLVESSVALAIMAVISVVLGWLVAGRVLRPLRTITAATQRVSADNLHERLALQGPRDELKDLSDTIDGLLGRLEGAFDAQRRFIANASHELRTPLTVGRALLEMILSDPAPTLDAYRSTCEDVLAAGKQQEQLIEALLTLARSQRGLEHRERFDLAHVVSDVLQSREPDAAQHGLTINAALEPARVAGDLRLIERLVANLVDNGLRHNVANGQLGIAVRNQTGNTTLTVTNSGPHVPRDQIDRLLQPFQHLDTTRDLEHDGLGLGLSIVAAIATAHGADLHVRPGDAGGLNVEVRFTSAPRGSGQATTTTAAGHGNGSKEAHAKDAETASTTPRGDGAAAIAWPRSLDE